MDNLLLLIFYLLLMGTLLRDLFKEYVLKEEWWKNL
jgi:hypothetical protein